MKVIDKITATELAAQHCELEATWTPSVYEDQIRSLLEMAKTIREGTNPTVYRIVDLRG